MAMQKLATNFLIGPTTLGPLGFNDIEIIVRRKDDIVFEQKFQSVYSSCLTIKVR